MITFQIIMILIDAIMIRLNYKWAKREEERGNNGLSKMFTFFFASWILFAMYDVFALAKTIFGG